MLILFFAFAVFYSV